MKNIKLYITTQGSYPEHDRGYGMDLVMTASLKEKTMTECTHTQGGQITQEQHGWKI